VGKPEVHQVDAVDTDGHHCQWEDKKENTRSINSGGVAPMNWGRLIKISALATVVGEGLLWFFWVKLAVTLGWLLTTYFFVILIAWQHINKPKFYIVYDRFKRRTRVHHYWLGFVTALLAYLMWCCQPQDYYIELIWYVAMPIMIVVSAWIFITEFKDMRASLKRIKK